MRRVSQLIIAWVGFSMCWIDVYAAGQGTVIFADEVRRFTDGTIIPANEQNKFDCRDRIHGIFMFAQLSPGEHQLQSRWHDPTGQVVQVNRRRVIVQSEQQNIYLSSSIEFRSSNGLMSMLDAASGLESYIGQWKVVLTSAGKAVGEGGFQVIC